MSTPRGRRTLTTEAPVSAASLAAVRRAEAAMHPRTTPEKEEVVIEPDLPVEPEPLTPEQLASLAAELARQAYLELVAAMPPDEPRWVVGARAKRLKVAGHILSKGDVVPGAEAWPRRDSWVNAGYIERT